MQGDFKEKMRMKALSIQQPWAWAIIHAGKDIENRTWPTYLTGPFYVHAGKKFDHAGYHWLLTNRSILRAEIPHPDNMLCGGIVGVSEIIDCVDSHPSPFFFGPWGFVLGYSYPVDFIPYKGKLGFFDIPNDIDKLTKTT